MISKGLFASLLFFSVFSCHTNKSERFQPASYSIEQLQNNLDLRSAAFNADESKILTHHNGTGIFNVYELNISDTGFKQLTHSKKESINAIDYVPGTSNFIYNSDQGGNENFHIFLQHPGDSSAKDLTPWPNSANSFQGWSQDKKSMFIQSNKRDPHFFDIWKIDTTGWKEKLFYKNDSGYYELLVSKSENWIAATKRITTNKKVLFLINSKTNQRKQISSDNEAIWTPQAFEANDSILYFTTNDNNEYSYLVRYNINTGKSEKLFGDNWDVVSMGLSENEKYYSISINEDGKNKVLLFDHSTGNKLDFPSIPDGDIVAGKISPSERNMVLAVGTSRSPINIYVYNFDKKDLKQLTTALNRSINPNDLVTAKVVRFKSYDGLEIPSIFYKPHQADKNNKVPGIIWVHGGPGGQSRIGYTNQIQFLVNHGYAVLAVNNRGSSGYGKTFYKMDDRKHGEGDLMDCIYGKKWLMSQDYIDSNKIAIEGGSYGGNMVLNALALHPNEFNAGVDLFGVANWLRTLRNIPPYWESFRKALYEEMGDPNSQDSVMLKTYSPLYNYEKIKKPLIVFQGSNDVRVLPIESDEIVAGVKKNGVPVEYVVFPDEGHGFNKKENQNTTANKTLAFLDKYVKADTTATKK